MFAVKKKKKRTPFHTKFYLFVPIFSSDSLYKDFDRAVSVCAVFCMTKPNCFLPSPFLTIQHLSTPNAILFLPIFSSDSVYKDFDRVGCSVLRVYKTQQFPSLSLSNHDIPFHAQFYPFLPIFSSDSVYGDLDRVGCVILFCVSTKPD